MYKKSTQKIINRIIFIVIIFAILCGIGIYILKYEVFKLDIRFTI